MLIKYSSKSLKHKHLYSTFFNPPKMNSLHRSTPNLATYFYGCMALNF